MSHGQNTDANAVAAGYRQFLHGSDARPLHYVHVWMLAQRAQGEGHPITEDYNWMTRHAGPWRVGQLPAYTTIQAGHVLANEQH
eukprot:6195403-Pleurochrysis_carterae.AAC.1